MSPAEDLAKTGFSYGQAVSRDGLTLHYRDYTNPASQQLPVLCLHGLTRNSGDFHHLANHLQKQRRVISPDLRGRGLSQHDPDMANYNPDIYAKDLWNLTESLGIHEFGIIGTSLGGWLAMLMQSQRPSAVAWVVMNDIGPELDPAGIARVAATAGTMPPVETFDQAVAQVSKFYGPIYPDWSEAQWQHFTKITYRPMTDGHYDLRLDRNVGRASRRGLSGLSHDPWELFSQLESKPVLTIRGETSDVLAPKTLEKMGKTKPDLQTVIVPQRGHAPFLNEAEANHGITNFLASNS